MQSYSYIHNSTHFYQAWMMGIFCGCSMCLEFTANAQRPFTTIQTLQFLNVILSLIFVNLILVFNFMSVPSFYHVNYVIRQ